MANYICLQELWQLRKIVYSMSTIHYYMVLLFSNPIVLECIIYSKLDLCPLQVKIALKILTSVLTILIGMKILDWFAKLYFVLCFEITCKLLKCLLWMKENQHMFISNNHLQMSHNISDLSLFLSSQVPKHYYVTSCTSLLTFLHTFVS